MITFSRDAIPEHGWREYRKISTTMMVRIDGPFYVETTEGRSHCDDGWLAIDARGNPYPVAADEHELIYEPVDPAPGAGPGPDPER